MASQLECEADAETHVGQATVAVQVGSNNSVDTNGNYAISPVSGSVVAGATGTPLSGGGTAELQVSGNFNNPSSNTVTAPVESQASVGIGSFFFVGVHAGYTFGGSGK